MIYFSIHDTYIPYFLKECPGTLTKLAISKVQKFEIMFLFYVLSFFKKGDTIQRGTLFKGDIIQGNTLCTFIQYSYQSATYSMDTYSKSSETSKVG